RFVLDKELVDIARTLSEDPLKALTTLPPDLTSAGWHVRRDTSGGGLTITVERPFANPADLNRAIADLRAGLASQQRPAARVVGRVQPGAIGDRGRGRRRGGALRRGDGTAPEGSSTGGCVRNASGRNAGTPALNCVSEPVRSPSRAIASGRAARSRRGSA